MLLILSFAIQMVLHNVAWVVKKERYLTPPVFRLFSVANPGLDMYALRYLSQSTLRRTCGAPPDPDILIDPLPNNPTLPPITVI